MNIQMVDLHGQYLKIKNQVDQNMQEVITNTSFINGKMVKDFAIDLASYLDAKAVVPCGNGTDALQIALMALDLKQGDEVILPVHTYVATAEVIALLGLIPIFVDVYPDTFTLNIEQVKENITPKTKAVVPVHLYGQCANMEHLLELAAEHEIYIVEDTAQALGADYIFSNGKKKKAGTIGHIGCTSFFPSKNLGCFGDGGAMIFNDEELAAKARMIANHGQRIKYHHDIIGCNSRLDSLQAAVLQAKLPHLDTYNEARKKVAKEYNKAFQDIEGIITPAEASYSTHVYHQYTIRLEQVDRDELKAALNQEGIPSMIYYPKPLHYQKAYKQPHNQEFPVAEYLSKQVLSLPMHTEMKEEMQEYIIQKFKKVYQTL